MGHPAGMPVVWIVNQYAGSPLHGMEYRHYHLARELTRRGHRVVVLSGSWSHLYTHQPEVSRPFTLQTIDGITYCWVAGPAYDRAGPGFTFAPVIVQPHSRGRVTLRSADPADTAVLDPGYLTEQPDVDAFVAGVELSRALAGTRALSEFVKEEIAPGPAVTSRRDIADFVRGNAGTLWHPVGTCAMGTGPAAVVDASLRVHGVRGLRVADASVMPRIVAGNTNAACVMIGERAADLVRADLGGAS